MKVIDLLNKIANGEIPKRIKKKDKIYVADDNNYFSNMYINENDSSHRLLLDFIPSLNDEVEIIEEDKGISKDIKWYLIEEQEKEETKIAQINMNFRIMREKMAEIIDYINKEK